MEIIELNSNNVVEGITGIIQQQKECVVYGIPDKNYVFCGFNTNFNKQYCNENNIGLLEFPNEGGLIIVNKGDFDIGHFSYKTENKFNYEFSDYLLKFLKNKNINANLEGNDLIIDGLYKCASFSSRRFNKILYSAYHISIGMNLDLIKNICTKEMIKTPKGLEDYGITTNEIEELFLDYINSHNI